MKKLIALMVLTASSIVSAQIGAGSDSGKDPVLGYLGNGDIADAAADFLRYNSDLAEGQGLEDYQTRGVVSDELGEIHVRADIILNGMKVHGAQAIVSSYMNSRAVFRVRSNYKPPRDNEVNPTVKPAEAFKAGLQQLGLRKAVVLDDIELGYVLNERGIAELAWHSRIEYSDMEGYHVDRLFVSAETAALITRHPQIHTAKNRRTYDGNNSSSLPGTLVRTEGSGASGDSCLDAAHDNAGIVYDYYNNNHSRDSYNGGGATIHSTVHHLNNYNNAFWDGSQMVYGDGDGSQFICLAQGYDVVAHELTHAVTDTSADLIYQNESGALNEAMSDVFAAASEAWRDGSVNSNTWKIGEAVYTPGTSGDALRFMNNPTADGSSYDYYPERYTGSADYGGVHLNSGIANLAFYLLTQGGTHPRGKTTVSVSGIGITKAANIFYRALTVYMGPSTNFSGARSDTISAATDLYGASSNEVVQVGKAWDAVGVAGPVPPQEIANGQTISGISGSSGSWRYFFINVPSGASDLSISISGGSGDADLYTRFGSQPTTSSYDCRPYLNGNNETCSVPSPSAGTYHIGIRAYSSYSGVSLTASYTGAASNVKPDASFTHSTNYLTANFTDTSSDSDGTIVSRSWNFGDGGTSSSTNPSHTYASAGTYTVTLTVTDDDGATDSASAQVTVTAPPAGPTELTNGQTVTGISGSTGEWEHFFISVPSGATNLNITISGGSGDADLYTRFGSQPTTSSYDCRPYLSGNNETCTVPSPNAGDYYIGIRAYSSFSGVSLTVSFTEPGGGSGGGGTVENISASTGQWRHYTLTVPAGQSRLDVDISGGTGDADLYIRYGAQPTTSQWDYRPYLNGNNESVSINNPTAGTWHISLRAYSSFSGVTLDAYYFP